MTDNPTCARPGCGRPIHDQAYICGECALWLAGRLELVAQLAGEAMVTIARQSHTPDSSSAPPPDIEPWDKNPNALYPTTTPVALTAAADHDAAVSTLTTWARHVHQESGRPLPTVATGRCPHVTCHQRHQGLIHGPRCDWPWEPPGHPLAATTRWLADQLRWLRYRPEAGEAFDELADACGLAERVVDRPAARWAAGTCDCGEPLTPTAAAATVTCRGCGVVHDLEERKAWLLEQAEDVLGGAAWCASTLSRLGVICRAGAVRQWALRSRLAGHGSDANGRALYRLGDVRALAQDAIRRDLLRQHEAEEKARRAAVAKAA